MSRSRGHDHTKNARPADKGSALNCFMIALDVGGGWLKANYHIQWDYRKTVDFFGIIPWDAHNAFPWLNINASAPREPGPGTLWGHRQLAAIDAAMQKSTEDPGQLAVINSVLLDAGFELIKQWQCVHALVMESVPSVVATLRAIGERWCDETCLTVLSPIKEEVALPNLECAALLDVLFTTGALYERITAFSNDPGDFTVLRIKGIGQIVAKDLLISLASHYAAALMIARIIRTHISSRKPKNTYLNICLTALMSRLRNVNCCVNLLLFSHTRLGPSVSPARRLSVISKVEHLTSLNGILTCFGTVSASCFRATFAPLALINDELGVALEKEFAACMHYFMTSVKSRIGESTQGHVLNKLLSKLEEYMRVAYSIIRSSPANDIQRVGGWWEVCSSSVHLGINKPNRSESVGKLLVPDRSVTRRSREVGKLWEVSVSRFESIHHETTRLVTGWRDAITNELVLELNDLTANKATMNDGVMEDQHMEVISRAFHNWTVQVLALFLDVPLWDVFEKIRRGRINIYQ